MSRTTVVQPGKVYGSLEVLRRAGATKSGLAKWACRCRKCGGTCVVVGRDLTTGRGSWKKKDCGCTERKKEIGVGKTFGALTIIRESETAYRTTKKWVVRCAVCGTEKEMLSSSIRRCPRSCGCLPRTEHKTAVKAGMAAIPVNVQKGVQVYVATKDTPNRDNLRGYRWVRVINRNGRQWIYALFQVQGKKYYRGGFNSLESAHDWAEMEHRRVLESLGIENPRKKEKKK